MHVQVLQLGCTDSMLLLNSASLLKLTCVCLAHVSLGSQAPLAEDCPPLPSPPQSWWGSTAVTSLMENETPAGYT